MTRVCRFALAVSIAAASTVALSADVRTTDKTQFKLEGMLGRMVGVFGGKAAREGAQGMNAVKGQRKVELGDTTGRIIDLNEEKVYELDMRRKTYEVTTFDEIRRRLREAKEEAKREAEREDPKDEPQPQEKPEKEYEIDFDVKETGQKRTLAGHEARQVISTVTVREKGRTLDDGGGAVMTVDSWIGPEIPALKELAEFDLKYARAIDPEAPALSAEQLAAVVALYPMLKNATERLQKEGEKLRGTPLSTTTTFEAVKSKAQIEEAKPSGGGGLGGMLARRVMKKEQKPRATVFTLAHETLEVSTNVSDADVAIPAGFKQK
ncbi:MAG TPA: hypothetical protein VE379_01415 [Vicinamibacterales bacterium]|jgi:hypothetical protein|nr:hypothetical protein [Vicinamibacterales bacterium]